MLLYVSTKASAKGNGTKDAPFQTISQAAEVATAGDEVIVAPGVYREWVSPSTGGISDACRITYRSEIPLAATITGAEQVKNWVHHQGNVWVAHISNELFGDFNPYTTLIQGDWYFPVYPLCLGEVYLNGKAMYESSQLLDVLQPTEDKGSWEPEFTVYRWFTEQSDETTVIYANFQGADPNHENVEINVRKHCFYPKETGINHIAFSGFTVKQAATQWAPPTAYQEGMIGPHWSKGWVIEDCEISDSRCSGISLGKYLQPNNENKWSTKLYKDGTQTERDAICQAQVEGWTKENIGSHIVRRCHIHDCGQTGIVGHLGGVFSIIEENHIHHINHRQDLFGAEIGGIKMHAAIDVVFRRNHIHHCTRGLWLDWQAQGTRVTANLFHDNTPPEHVSLGNSFMVGEDLFVEVSHGPTLIDNNIMLSPAAAKLSTQGLAFVHNLIAGSFTAVGSGTDNGSSRFPSPRYTPYHMPHRTEIAGFMTFLHGDARFHNNIFVQQPLPTNLEQAVQQDLTKMKAAGDAGEAFAEKPNFTPGTHPYQGYPTADEYFARFHAANHPFLVALQSGKHVEYMAAAKARGETIDLDPNEIKGMLSSDRYYDHLPVYTGGNLYFNGAKPCDKEQNFVVDTDHSIDLRLENVDGNYVLKTNLYEAMPELSTQMITTEVLGEAFEPEQKFENADGTPIAFDIDYFGAQRTATPVPGPFEMEKACCETEFMFQL